MPISNPAFSIGTSSRVESADLKTKQQTNLQ